MIAAKVPKIGIAIDIYLAMGRTTSKAVEGCHTQSNLGYKLPKNYSGFKSDMELNSYDFLLQYDAKNH